MCLKGFLPITLHAAGTISLNSATWKPIGGTVTIVDRAVKIGTGTIAALYHHNISACFTIN